MATSKKKATDKKPPAPAPKPRAKRPTKTIADKARAEAFNEPEPPQPPTPDVQDSDAPLNEPEKPQDTEAPAIQEQPKRKPLFGFLGKIKLGWVIGIAGGVFLLWLVLKGCNDQRATINDSKAVKKNESNIRDWKAAYDSIELEKREIEIRADDNAKYAQLEHAQNEKLTERLNQSESQLADYLKNQKTKSDATKKTIDYGTRQQLDSMWERIKLTNGYKD